MLTLEMNRRVEADKITFEMRDKRLQILFETFPDGPDLFMYLLQKFNDDDDIPIAIVLDKDENYNPRVALSKKLVDKAEEFGNRLLRDLAVEVLGEDVVRTIEQ